MGATEASNSPPAGGLKMSSTMIGVNVFWASRVNRCLAVSDTKRLILEKATQLFYEKGFVRGSIRDIADAVGVSNATLYVHFKDKNAILFDIVEEIGAVLLEELRQVIETHDDPVECLQAMVVAQMSLIKDKRREIKIYLEEQYQLSGKLRRIVRKKHLQIYKLYKEKITELKSAGLFREVDETVSTFCISAMMNWAYRWCRTDGRLSIQEIAEQMSSLFFGGMLEKSVSSSEGDSRTSPQLSDERGAASMQKFRFG